MNEKTQNALLEEASLALMYGEWFEMDKQREDAALQFSLAAQTYRVACQDITDSLRFSIIAQTAVCLAFRARRFDLVKQYTSEFLTGTTQIEHSYALCLTRLRDAAERERVSFS